jgi:Glycosyltransferase family 87
VERYRYVTRAGLALMLAWVFLAAFFVRGNGDDWRIFWDVGHKVGSTAVITASHFAYTPGAAWAIWPLARLPIATGYFIYVVIMVALTGATAWLAKRVYGLPFSVPAVMAFAWAPFTIAICLGQNAPLALLFTMLAIAAFVRGDDLLLGASVGLLLYKPSDAVPLIFLLFISKQWRSLGVVALCGAAWYLLSVAAANDWLWPIPYAHMLHALYHTDRVANTDYAISLPTILGRFGARAPIRWAVGAVMLLGSAPFLLRVGRREAASVVPLVGIAASPHAWGYEAILALPAMWLAVTRPSPLRLALVAMAYLIAPLYLYVRPLHFDMLAIPVVGGTAYWFAIQARSIWSYRAAARNMT